MNEPTLAQIAAMATEIYVHSKDRMGFGRAVKMAFGIWDEAAKQWVERRDKKSNE